MQEWDLGEDRPDACGYVGWLREPVHCTACAAAYAGLEAADAALRGRVTLDLWVTGGEVYAQVVGHGVIPR